MASNPLHQQLCLWARAMAGEQVNRHSPTGAERIDQVPDVVALGVEVMRVEMAVQRMEATGRWKEARVLRTEYFMAGLSEADRLAYRPEDQPHQLLRLPDLGARLCGRRAVA